MAFHQILHNPPTVNYLKGGAAENLLLGMFQKSNHTPCSPQLLQPRYLALLSPNPTLLTTSPENPPWALLAQRHKAAHRNHTLTKEHNQDPNPSLVVPGAHSFHQKYCQAS